MTFWWSLVNLINFKINLQFKNCLSENCILWHLLIRLYHGDSDKFNKVKVDINYIAPGVGSSKVFEGGLFTCWICLWNEFWSIYEASHIFVFFSNITCWKCSTFVLMIAPKIKSGSKFIFEQFESGSNFIFNTWSETNPKIWNASQVNQSSFHMHIQHVIRSPSHGLDWIKVHTPGYIKL